ncbi:MAG: 16S rRNA (cytidine(1402)-2'-O)-methyltransferase [Muribaculaceae bacterium]|nr:16S rRNA (cytidine(1402)-2'-O)-methyltransferase [Muribaculaceae bacterium]
MAGKLYMVPTPVGNLEDMTMRAIRVLKEADLILAEDTRTSGVLLKHFDIKTPMQSHHKFNEHQTCERIADRIEGGENIALVTDAGTPGISDPGFMLSRACRERGLEVECLPGATAFVPALVASGLPCERFVFEGFLPMKKGRATRLAELAADPRTCVIYESPLRLARTLRQLAETFGVSRPAAVCREISKLHETINKATLGELADYYGVNQAKGEIVIVVEGSGKQDRRERGGVAGADENEQLTKT